MSQVHVSMLNSYRELQEEAKKLGVPHNLNKEDLLGLIISEVEKDDSKKSIYIEMSKKKKVEEYRKKKLKRQEEKEKKNKENKCFQEALRSTQQRPLKASRARRVLLVRILNFKKLEATSSEGEETESSDDGETTRSSDAKRRTLDVNSSSSYGSFVSGLSKAPTSEKKEKPTTPKPLTKSPSQPQLQMVSGLGDGHMTPEELERHLKSKPHYRDMTSEMFTTDPSLDIDSESNELCEMETSLSSLDEDRLIVDMMAD